MIKLKSFVVGVLILLPSIVISGLREVGSCSTPGLAREVFVSGNYAYIADGNGGLRVIDVSDPTNPSEVGHYSSSGFNAVDLFVSGSYAYVSYYNRNTWQGGLKVINISNPSAPNPVGDVILVNQGDTRGVYGEGGYVYVTYTLSSSMSGGVKVVDISSPSNPQVIGDIELNPGPPFTIYVRGNYAYVGYINPANNGKGLCILDVSNPSNPVIVSRYSVSSSGDICTVMDVDVEGNYVYFAPCDGGMDIIDVSNPSSPWGVSSYGSRCKAVDVEGDYAYVGEDYDLKVLNVSNVNNPTLEDQVTLPSVIQGIDVSGNYIYVADYLNGLKIFEYTTSNYAPSATRPSGPSSGNVGQSLTYHSTVTDPDEDQVYVQFDWGDGHTSSWIGPYSSGHTFYVSHSWHSAGTYCVKARGKDSRGNIGNWSSCKTVAITSPNHSPTITRVHPAHQDTTVSVNNNISFEVSVSDEDGDLDHVHWQLSSNGVPIQQYDDESVSGSSGTSQWNQLFDGTGSFQVSATAYDNQGNHSDPINWNITVENAPPETLTIGNMKLTANNVERNQNNYILNGHVKIINLSNSTVWDLGDNSEVTVNTANSTVTVLQLDLTTNVLGGFFRLSQNTNVTINAQEGTVSFDGVLSFGNTFRHNISSAAFTLYVNSMIINGNVSFSHVPLLPPDLTVSMNISLPQKRAELNFSTGYSFEIGNALTVNIGSGQGNFIFDFQNLIFLASGSFDAFSVSLALNGVTITFSPVDLGAEVGFELNIPDNRLTLANDFKFKISIPVLPARQADTLHPYLAYYPEMVDTTKTVEVGLGVVVDSGSYIEFDNGTLLLMGSGSLGLNFGVSPFSINIDIAHLSLNTQISDTLWHFYTQDNLHIGNWLEIASITGQIDAHPCEPSLYVNGNVVSNNYPSLFNISGDLTVYIDVRDQYLYLELNGGASLFGYVLDLSTHNMLEAWNTGVQGESSTNISFLNDWIHFSLDFEGYSDFEQQIGSGSITAGVHVGPVDINAGAGYSIWIDTMQVYADVWGHVVTYTFVHHSSKGDTNVVTWRFNPYDGITVSLKNGILKGITSGEDTITLADTLIKVNEEGIAAWLHPESDSGKNIILNKMFNLPNGKNSLTEIMFESAGADSLNMDILIPGAGCKYLYKIRHNTADNSRAKATIVSNGGEINLMMDIDGNGVYEDTVTIIPDTIPSYKDGNILYVRQPVIIDLQGNTLNLSWITSIPTRSIVLWGNGINNIADTLYSNNGYVADYNVDVSISALPDSFYIKVISTDSRGAQLAQGPIFINRRFYETVNNDTLAVGSVIGAPGTIVRVPVELKHQDIVSALQTTVVWDSSKLKFQNVALDSQYSGFWIRHNNFGDSLRVVIVSISGDSILPGRDTLFYVSFLVDSNATLGDSSYLNLHGTVLSDPLGEHLPVVSEGGWVYIMGLKGDLNQDGVIDVTDVVREINIILGKPPAPTQYEEWAGDMNEDGTIDVTDAVAIINVILGNGKGPKVNGKARIWLTRNKVMLNSNCEIAGIQFDLTGNISDLRPGRNINGMDLYANKISNGYRVLLISLDGATLPQGERDIIEFNGNGEIRNVVISDKNGDRVEVNSSRYSQVTLYPITPNPIKSEGYLRFGLPERARVRIKLYDVSGREVKEIADREFESGFHTLKIRAEGLRSGVYFLRLEIGSANFVRRLVVRK